MGKLGKEKERRVPSLLEHIEKVSMDGARRRRGSECDP